MATDVLVSARIAQGKKDATKSVLAALGATTSDLINSAFDYVLEKRALPGATAQGRPTMDEFVTFVAGSSLAVDWGGNAPDGDYRTLLREGKREAYESLA
ncbi:type II toxin-antitoxin system RelB/DinJ family antitoxin [uncultured Adlercreutzia sp.]|uniref:type II toxin-antitoxin system RelB/DinJ family antitoxin n=1 Tax=uncultured Adlercreutzia sp. TaxID=875803 RepID=UPI0025DA2017|nr:type II toxin-antitoxin system RelB/DinJ family antitoxin [uncultured Adlercreutzia sp.]